MGIGETDDEVLQRILETRKASHRLISELRAQVEKLEAENERLNAALTEIARRR